MNAARKLTKQSKQTVTMTSRTPIGRHGCETLDQWVPEYVDRIDRLPAGYKAPSKLWFSFTHQGPANDPKCHAVMVHGDYVGGIQTALLKDEEPLPNVSDDAAGRCIGIAASAVLPSVLGGDNLLNSIMMTPAIRSGMGDITSFVLVPYDGHQITWSQLRRVLGDEAADSLTLVVKRTLVALCPMLLMHYSDDELQKLEEDGEDLLDDLMDKFHLEIAWNQLSPNSIATGGSMPWAIDVGIVGWFGEQEFDMDRDMCDGFLTEHSVHLPFCGELAETIRPYFPKIIDMVRDEIIGGAMNHPTIPGRIDWFLTHCKAAATAATVRWDALPTTSIPITGSGIGEGDMEALDPNNLPPDVVPGEMWKHANGKEMTTFFPIDRDEMMGKCPVLETNVDYNTARAILNEHNSCEYRREVMARLECGKYSLRAIHAVYPRYFLKDTPETAARLLDMGSRKATPEQVRKYGRTEALDRFERGRRAGANDRAKQEVNTEIIDEALKRDPALASRDNLGWHKGKQTKWRPEGKVGKSVGKPIGSSAAETEEQRQERIEANRQMMAKLSGSGGSGGAARRQPANPTPPVDTSSDEDQSAGPGVNQSRLDAFHEQETIKHKAESEAQRRVREAAEAEKERKAKEWAPSVLPGASGPSRGWVEEAPGESERAKRRGKKAEKLQARKEAIAKRRAEEAAAEEKQRKILEEKARALKIGQDMMREQREPVQLR